MKDILERIVEARKIDIAADRRTRPAASLARSAPGPRAAFGGERPPMIIAECKRASPSRGMLAETYDPAALALAYEKGGAGMISVITEPRFFLGSASHLEAARQSVSLPLLRKDFILEPYQIREAWAIGADVILLIAAILEESALKELASCAREHSLSVLVEVRESREIGKALACSPDAIGVNMRDLKDFSEDGGLSREARARKLRALLPRNLAAVAESGLKSPADAVGLRLLGYDAFLVGETFVRAADPESEVRAFVGALARADAERREEA
jgi:indole-3-glycerol phosphate synthase